MVCRQRNYELIAKAVASRCRDKSRIERMQIVVDALWGSLNSAGVSWVGFYIDRPTEPDDRRLVLGPCRDKPACSPIGMHGVCGRAFKSGNAQVVNDIRVLGDDYIACDPHDLSEVVVPVVDRFRRCRSVLDLDSHELNAFKVSDVVGIQAVLVSSEISVQSEIE